MQLAPILREAMDMWQNPSFGELSPEAFLAVANRCISERFLDLDLTPDACFVTDHSRAFSFTASSDRKKNLSSIITDVSRVIRVESRGSSSVSDDDWEEESVASFENWSDILERGDKSYVAFYGTPPSLKMVVNRDVSNLDFRLVYKVIRSEITTPTAFIELPDIYKPVLVYDIALEMGEVIDNRSPEFIAKKRDKMSYLEGRRAASLQSIEKWRRSQRGTSVTTRRSFSDRQEVFQSGKRRFSVRY